MLLLSTIKLVIKESQTNISHTSFWEIELASIALKQSQIKIQTFNRFKNQTTWCCFKARSFKTPCSRIMIIHTFFTCSIIMLYEYLCRSSYRIGKGVSPKFRIKLESQFFEDWAMMHAWPCHENENSWQLRFKLLWWLIMEITPHKFSPLFDKIYDILFICCHNVDDVVRK